MTPYIVTAGSTDQVNRHKHRQHGVSSSAMLGFLVRKFFWNSNFNIAMLFVCPCVSVCIITFLNRVTEWYEYGENIDDLGGHSVITMWTACEILSCELRLLAVHILYATRQRRNTNIY